MKGTTMSTNNLLKDTPIRSEDLPRWLTFTSFWGASSYVLSCVSLIAGSRSHPVRIEPATIGLGMLLHTATFMATGSLAVATGSIVSGKSSTEVSQQDISGGSLERSVAQQGAGGAFGSLVPFALALGSLELAGKLTGRPAFGEPRRISWPRSLGTMVAASGLLALAVARITAWVAEDAKS